MNDLTSFGIHRLWKNDLINWLAPQRNQKLADIAGGTGDIAKKFLIESLFKKTSQILSKK